MEELRESVFVVELPEDRDTSYRRYGIYSTYELAEARVKELTKDKNVTSICGRQRGEDEFWITKIEVDQ